MTDRLAEIKARHHATKVMSEHNWTVAQADIGLLISEVERLRKENDRLKRSPQGGRQVWELGL